jgi:hypothetical protein
VNLIHILSGRAGVGNAIWGGLPSLQGKRASLDSQIDAVGGIVGGELAPEN